MNALKLICLAMIFTVFAHQAEAYTRYRYYAPPPPPPPSPCVYGPGNYAVLSVWVAPASSMSDQKVTYVPLTLTDYLNGTGQVLLNAYVTQLQNEGYQVYSTTGRIYACF
jgi:hypothetical protein